MASWECPAGRRLALSTWRGSGPDSGRDLRKATRLSETRTRALHLPPALYLPLPVLRPAAL